MERGLSVYGRVSMLKTDHLIVGKVPGRSLRSASRLNPTSDLYQVGHCNQLPVCKYR